MEVGYGEITIIGISNLDIDLGEYVNKFYSSLKNSAEFKFNIIYESDKSNKVMADSCRVVWLVYKEMK